MRHLILFLILIVGMFGGFLYFLNLGKKSINLDNIDAKQSINNQIVEYEEQYKQKEESEFLYPWKKDNLLSYEKPVYRFDVAYGEVFSDPEWTHLGEVSRRFDKENQQWFAKIKGYSHYFKFLGFGVEVGTSNPYDEDFVTKNPEIFRRYFSGNYDVLYTMGDFYIQKFEKNINQNFDLDYLQEYHLATGCSFVLYDYGSHEWDVLKMQGKYLVYQLSSSKGGSCDLNGNNVVYFVYNPNNPQYYYKLSWQDGCAPSCGIPTYLALSF